MMFVDVNYFAGTVLGITFFIFALLLIVYLGVGLNFVEGKYEIWGKNIKKSFWKFSLICCAVMLALVSLIVVAGMFFKTPTNDFSQADRVNSEVFVKKIVEVSEIDSLSSDSKKTAYSADLDDFKDNGYVSLSGVKGDDSVNLLVSFNEKTNTMIVKSSVAAEGSETKTYKYTP